MLNIYKKKSVRKLYIKILHLTARIGNMDELSFWYLMQLKQKLLHWLTFYIFWEHSNFTTFAYSSFTNKFTFCYLFAASKFLACVCSYMSEQAHIFIYNMYTRTYAHTRIWVIFVLDLPNIEIFTMQNSTS